MDVTVTHLNKIIIDCHNIKLNTLSIDKKNIEINYLLKIFLFRMEYKNKLSTYSSIVHI